jgi:hypothetical protein
MEAITIGQESVPRGHGVVASALYYHEGDEELRKSDD